ncbi:MAG: (2Fe-2S)-binding protein [Desulfatiglandales bacterium]|jgi:carbon-monoxide dehydrogenase small subunit|nr:(2Fe-2S)-binding protein [Desulfatiglandales bacterium]
MKEEVTLQVNGDSYEVFIGHKKTLLEVLREDIGLTGTKEVCDLGSCGACTVLLDKKPVLSCLTLAVPCKGREIITIEGLKKGEELHPLQSSFLNLGAIQCGMCTPGMILTAKALLDENPHPTEMAVREAIAGNLCRCTGYLKIVEAILAVPDDKSNIQKGE